MKLPDPKDIPAPARAAQNSDSFYACPICNRDTPIRAGDCIYCGDADSTPRLAGSVIDPATGKGRRFNG